MIKINPQFQDLSISSPAPSATTTSRRLIVPIQSPDLDLPTMSRRIWEIAESTQSDIKLIGLCNDAMHEPGIRRVLVTLLSMVNYGNISADMEVVIGKDWLGAVKSRCRSDDMVVCWQERGTGSQRKPFSQVLQSELDVPLYVISVSPAEKEASPRWIVSVTAWIGFLFIILGFFMLQVRIYQLSSPWTVTLELLSTAAEFGAIWVWNNLFG